MDRCTHVGGFSRFPKDHLATSYERKEIPGGHLVTRRIEYRCRFCGHPSVDTTVYTEGPVKRSWWQSREGLIHSYEARYNGNQPFSTKGHDILERMLIDDLRDIEEIFNAIANDAREGS